MNHWIGYGIACGLLWANLVEQSVSAERPPNVIVIMTDDQGYGEFSCHGNPLVQTPHIDRLAAASQRLTDFHVAPMCTPTRGQLLTGLDAFRNGAINVSSGRTLLRADLKTMADVFRAAGYRTGVFGKWHLGDNYPFRPQDRGFEESLWFPSSHIGSVPDYWENDYFDDTYIHNGVRQKYSGYCTDIFFEEACRWMAVADQRPFWAYLPLNAAHAPWFVPAAYRQSARQAVDAAPAVTEQLSAAQRENLISFLAMGANIDDNVGRLEQFLTARGMFENTIVVFLTDNGSTFGEQYFNAGLRGKKTQLWEGGHRVPCFIRWPKGGFGEPREIDELTHVQDLFPTLAELAGVPGVPTGLDGQSLAPLLRGTVSQLADRMLVINYSRMPQFEVSYTTDNPALPHRDGAGVLWGPWRWLENRQLYNVETDPHQDRDVAHEHPEVVARMRAHLDKWWEGVRHDVFRPQRVVIGSDQENPLMLTACEWLDVFVDQQLQVRRGERKNGDWHLSVAVGGEYEFELRRWPRESHLPNQAAIATTQVADGSLPAGPAFPIATARLQIAGEKRDLAADAAGQAFTVRLPLPAGPCELRTTLLDEAGQEICGAYYVYVRRL